MAKNGGAGASVNIDNYLNNPDKPIDSPRTLEACLRCGVDTAELYPQPLEAFKANSREPDALTQIKFDHYEKRRKGAQFL